MLDYTAFFALFDYHPIIAGHIAIHTRVHSTEGFIAAYCRRVGVDNARAMIARVLKLLRDRGCVDFVTQRKMLQQAWRGFSAEDFEKLFPLLALPPRPEAPFTLLPFSQAWHGFAARFYEFEKEAPASLFVALSRHYRAPMCNWNERGCFLRAYFKNELTGLWAFELELFDVGLAGFYAELARGFIETEVKVHATLRDRDCVEETLAALAAIPDAPWLKKCVRFSHPAFRGWMQAERRPLLHSARVRDCLEGEAESLLRHLAAREALVITGRAGSLIVIEAAIGGTNWVYRERPSGKPGYEWVKVKV